MIIRDSQMDALAASHVAERRRAQIAGLREQGFDVREDPTGKDLLIEDKSGGSARVVAVPNGVSVTSGEQRTHVIGFDGQARLTSIVDPAGSEIRLTRDELGRVTAISNGTERVHEFGFDASNRVNLVRSPDGSEFRYEYDQAGRVIDAFDANGNVASYSYSKSGLLSSITDWGGNVTGFGYADGNIPTAVVLPNGTRREWISSRTPGGRSLYLNGSFHAAVGSVEGQKDVVGVFCDDGTEARFRYQGDRLVEAANAVCTVRFEYDNQGRVIKECVDDRSIAFVRNNVGSLIGLVNPDGARLAFERDKEQRVVRITDWKGGASHFAYAPNGAVARIDYPNGVACEFTSDEVGLATRMSVHAVGSQTVTEVEWQSDLCNRVQLQIVDGARFEYKYDANGRLVSENGIDYTLDPNGNRISGPHGRSEFDGANQIESWATQKIRHDERGNMTNGPTPNGYSRFTWDGLDRLTRVDAPDTTARYFYDALGRRVRKEAGGEITRYSWAGDLLLSEETTRDGFSQRREFLYFPGTKLVLAMRVGRECHYLHFGRRGETVAMTGDGGELLWKAQYDGFGHARITHEKVPQPWRLLGNYFDSETGLHYVQARYYNPNLGRFLSVDPQGFAGGSLNLYTYCDGDPINSVDPTGELAFLAIAGVIAVGAAIGAVVGGAVEAYKQHKAHPDRPLDWGQIGKEAGKGAIVGAVGSGVGLILGAAATAAAAAAGTAGLGALAVGSIVVGGGAVAGALTAAIEQCVDNKLHDRPLFHDIGAAMAVGGAVGAVTAGIGAIWANRARRLAQAARETEEAARRAEQETARLLAEESAAEERALAEARLAKEGRMEEGRRKAEEAALASQKRRADKDIGKEWARYNRANDGEFKSRLREFRGSDNLQGEKGMAGGEGQIYLSDQNRSRALKRWFGSRSRDFNDAVGKLNEAERVVKSNGVLNKELDVVHVYERGSDWIVRDFDRSSIPIKKAGAEAQAARQRAIAALRGADDEMSKDILKKLESGSSNIHWSPEKGKLLLIDTQ